MKRKMTAITVLAAAALMVVLSGCGKKAGGDTAQPATEKQAQTETQAQVVTEAPTEAEVLTEAFEIATEAITEAAPETEPATETEAQVQTETQAQRDLTADEEKAEEEDYAAPAVMYAKDDINIRSNPTTDEENIISSFDQGEEVSVTGETPNWYIISKDDFTGYVRKDGLSEEEVEPKTPEEREQLSGSTGSSSATDAEYGVSLFAESYPVHVAGDANLRAEPSENGDVIGTVSADTNVQALGETSEWYKVEAEDGTVGFVHKNLVG